MGRSMLLLLATGMFTPLASGAQEPSPLVVVIGGEAQYHRPACPLVAKAGPSVTMMKQSEAATRGLAAHDCDGAAIDQPKKDANAAAVFVQPGDTRYHKAGCGKLSAAASRATLGEAGKKYWPCPVCKPPIRQRVKGTG